MKALSFLTVVLLLAACSKRADPFAGTKDFTNDFYFPHYSELLTKLKADGSIQFQSNKDYETGGGPLIFTDTKNNTELVVYTVQPFRFGAANTSLGDDEYYTAENLLQKARFYMYDDMLPGDSVRCTETIYDFVPEEVNVQIREKDVPRKGSDHNDMGGVKFMRLTGKEMIRTQLAQETADAKRDIDKGTPATGSGIPGGVAALNLEPGIFDRLADSSLEIFSPGYENILAGLRANKNILYAETNVHAGAPLNYRRFLDTQSGTELIIMKGGPGEFATAASEFLLVNNKVMKVRDLVCKAQENAKGMTIEEKIFDFTTPVLLIKTRSKNITRDETRNYKLSGTAYKMLSVREELRQQVNIEYADRVGGVKEGVHEE